MALATLWFLGDTVMRSIVTLFSEKEGWVAVARVTVLEDLESTWRQTSKNLR